MIAHSSGIAREISFKKAASSKNRREEGFGLPMDIEPDIRMMFDLSHLIYVAKHVNDFDSRRDWVEILSKRL